MEEAPGRLPEPAPSCLPSPPPRSPRSALGAPQRRGNGFLPFLGDIQSEVFLIGAAFLPGTCRVWVTELLLFTSTPLFSTQTWAKSWSSERNYKPCLEGLSWKPRLQGERGLLPPSSLGWRALTPTHWVLVLPPTPPQSTRYTQRHQSPELGQAFVVCFSSVSHFNVLTT